MSDIKFWSVLAASNNATPPDGFPEEMKASDLNNASREVMAAIRRWYEDAEWIDYNAGALSANGTDTIKIAGSHTSLFTVSRRIRAKVGAGTIYGDIASATAVGGETSVQVTWDSGQLDNSLTGVALSSIRPLAAQSPIPKTAVILSGNSHNVTALTAVTLNAVQGSLGAMTVTGATIKGGTIGSLSADLAVSDGGTGHGPFSTNRLIYHGTAEFTEMAAGSSGQILQSAGAGNPPVWATPSNAGLVPIPAGSNMIFYASTPPTGWTQNTTVQDRTIRIVSGTGGGFGGSWAVSGMTVAGHTLDTNQIPSHSHTVNLNTGTESVQHRHRQQGASVGGGTTMTAVTNGGSTGQTETFTDVNDVLHIHAVIGPTTAVGGGGSHSHGISSDASWRPAYIDCIVAVKN